MILKLIICLYNNFLVFVYLEYVFLDLIERLSIVFKLLVGNFKNKWFWGVK